MDSLSVWLDTPTGSAALFGFGLVTLLWLWKKASTRWANWHPVLAKLARWALYGLSVVVLILFMGTTDLFTPVNLMAMILGGGLIPTAVLGLNGSLGRREKIRRGARIASAAIVERQARRQLPRADFVDTFEFGGVPVPRSAEPYHFLVVGATGTGKSVAITRLLDRLEARGDTAIVVDSGGEFASRYFKPGRDSLLNPFDDRCVPWAPTVEMQGPWDADALARSIIPDGVGDSKEWNGYAQTFISSILRKLSEQNKLSIQELLYFAQAAPISELETFLVGTPALAQLASDRTFGSIRTIASSFLGTYAYLTPSDNPFSVSKFIQAEKPGFLFLTYRDDQLDSLRSLISCVLDVAARTILALPPNAERRVWLIIDEFASIGKVQSIEAIATKARKVGGCLLLGLQSVSQLQERYGEKGAQSILGCLSSWMVLRCSDVDTAEYISKYIGDTEVSRMTQGKSSSDTGGSNSLNEQIQTQRAVLPIEIQKLANLEGFFRLAGAYPICRTKLKYAPRRKTGIVAYAARDFVAKPMLALAPVSDDSSSAARTEPPAQPIQAELPSAPLAPQVSGPQSALSAMSALKKTPLAAGPGALMSVLEDFAADIESEL